MISDVQALLLLHVSCEYLHKFSHYASRKPLTNNQHHKFLHLNLLLHRFHCLTAFNTTKHTTHCQHVFPIAVFYRSWGPGTTVKICHYVVHVGVCWRLQERWHPLDL